MQVHEGRPQSKEREVIERPAVRYMGEVFTGENHALAFEQLAAKHPHLSYKNMGNLVEDGFTTSTGRFVDREEAFAILNNHPDGITDRLDSADL